MDSWDPNFCSTPGSGLCLVPRCKANLKLWVSSGSVFQTQQTRSFGSLVPAPRSRFEVPDPDSRFRHLEVRNQFQVLGPWSLASKRRFQVHRSTFQLPGFNCFDSLSQNPGPNQQVLRKRSPGPGSQNMVLGPESLVPVTDPMFKAQIPGTNQHVPFPRTLD